MLKLNEIFNAIAHSAISHNAKYKSFQFVTTDSNLFLIVNRLAFIKIYF